MNPAANLNAGYRAMATDADREAEAQAWCNGMTREAMLTSDPQERETLDWIEQVADTDGWTT